MTRMMKSSNDQVRLHWLVCACTALCLFTTSTPSFAQYKSEPPTEQAPEEAAEQPIEQPIDETLATEEEDVADEAALDSELASAMRFETELDALLLPDGQIDTTKENAQIKLNSLATRCGILANSAMHDQVKLLLLGYQARALSALLSLEPAEQGLDRMEQLNDAAQQIAAIDEPGTSAVADYWLLVASMTRQASTKLPASKRQAHIEQSLRAFIEMHQEEPEAAEYLLDVRLSLAQLMDQRGAQQDAVKQLNRIGKLPEDSPRLGEAKHLRESIARLGTKINFESISTQLVDWRSSDHLGKPVLIHVFADSVEPSVRMIDVISRRIVEGTISEIAVVSLRVGEPLAGRSDPPWPTLPVQLERGGVLDQLGVTALPTLAWLDSEGRLASIGTTAAVLDQLASLKAEAPDKAEPRPQAEQEPLAQPQLETEQDATPEAPADQADTDVENPEN